MTDDYKILRAGVHDLDGVLDVLSQLSHTEKTHELRSIYAAIINDPKYVLLIVKHDKKIVGTAMLVSRYNLSHGGKRVGYLENVVVDKEHRGNKLGEKLVEHLLEEAPKLNCYKVILDCSQDNVFFYNKYGFELSDEANMRFDIK